MIGAYLFKTSKNVSQKSHIDRLIRVFVNFYLQFSEFVPVKVFIVSIYDFLGNNFENAVVRTVITILSKSERSAVMVTLF